MNCLSQMIGYFSYAIEQLGLYEPEINVQEARRRLNLERKLWEKSQSDRNELWNIFQTDNMTNGPLPSLVEKAITHLESHNIKRGVAVDLSCGINTTTFNLLEQGWKVYAVDSSEFVIKNLEQKASSIGKSWINDGKLVLINQAIEEFAYPEKVHLITATESLPYCDPTKITKIFLEAKSALLPQGVLVCNLFPYTNFPVDNMLRGMFGGWMTTKNVVEAVVRSVDFSSWSVTEGKSPQGLAKQFHIFAQA
jgi:SAM-dependent methyltransferase